MVDTQLSGARTFGIITPKENAKPPVNTGRGWQFPFDSQWHPIGPDKPYPQHIAEHAQNFFTQREANAEPRCLVDVEFFEGELQFQPAGFQPEHACPVDGCGQKFTDVAALASHIKECATRSTEERAAAALAKQEADSKKAIEAAQAEAKKAQDALKKAQSGGE